MEKQQQGEQPHKRRARYKGTHPRKYSEKYKELNPEKYQDTIEKVIQKGSTPAGMHISICVREILDYFRSPCFPARGRAQGERKKVLRPGISGASNRCKQRV
ncbi:hypothetical protein IMSAGC005_02271 [Lachnospiraceae bacterium]|nr:hypothetical protein IMSAGC005_02271 [Lachnospiraceae bacterium]